MSTPVDVKIVLDQLSAFAAQIQGQSDRQLRDWVRIPEKRATAKAVRELVAELTLAFNTIQNADRRIGQALKATAGQVRA
jgi:small-conductance mechanosensitive channel